MWLPLAPRMLWVVRCHEGGAGVAGARAVWRWSAAQGLRALGRFGAATDGKICAPCVPKRLFAGLFGYMARTSCQSQLVSDAWRADLARKPPFFSSEAPFGIHGVKKLPRIAAWERIRAQSCHRQAPGNAFRGHFAISERPQRHSAMCLNVLRRSPIDARAERPAHALRARCSCPRAARHSAAMPCTVRGAFVAAGKVSCGLRVSMR